MFVSRCFYLASQYYLTIAIIAFALCDVASVHAQETKGRLLGTPEEYTHALDSMRKTMEEDEKACPSAAGMEWAQEREGGIVCRPVSENKKALRKFCTRPQNNEELTACLDAIDRMPCASLYEEEYSKKNAIEVARKYSALRAADKGGNKKAAEFIQSLPSGMPTLECRDTATPVTHDSASVARALKVVSDEWDKIREKRCRAKQQEELKREQSDRNSRPANAIEQAKRRIQCSHYQAVDVSGKPVLNPVPQSVDGVYKVSEKTGVVRIYDLTLCAEIRKTLGSESFACYRP